MKTPTLTPFTLRPATDDDLAQVVAIEAAVHVAPWTEENFREELAKPYCQFLVQTDDETDTEVAGYIVFWMMFDECQILNVAVAPTYQRQGFAQEMVRKVISLAQKKGIKKVTLDVRKSNQAAIDLYQGIGFTVSHIRKALYSNGEDGYQMDISLLDDAIQF